MAEPIVILKDIEMSGATASVGEAHQAFRRMRHFASLDGFRAASILAAIYHHSAMPLAWFPATYRRFLGVDMFFVLSGFLIVTLLIREKDSRGKISLKNFYIRRTLRIFPVYYGILLALSFAYLLGMGQPSSSDRFFAALPFYLTYTSNWIT